MAREFTVQRGATRVVFGAGTSGRIAREIDALGLARVLVLSTPGRRGDATRLAAQLGARAVGVFAEAREHVPLETATAGRAEAVRANADAVLAIGGGSAIGLAKAIALEGRARAIAVPTTYAGSEMTALYGVTDG
jgi:maleylacetate reductase